MLYRFYQLENGIKRYLRDDCESYTRDVGLAGTFSQAAWDEWGYDGFELEEIGEDEKMRLAGAPRLPGMDDFFGPNPDCTGKEPYTAFGEWAAANGYDLDDDSQLRAAMEEYGDDSAGPPLRVTA